VSCTKFIQDKKFVRPTNYETLTDVDKTFYFRKETGALMEPELNDFGSKMTQVS
jgi:hypothetical protein